MGQDDKHRQQNDVQQVSIVHHERKADDEIWFATISESSLGGRMLFPGDSDDRDEVKHSHERWVMLLAALGDWHRPVPTLIRTTPAEGIMYHHNAAPLFGLGRIMEIESWRRGWRGGRRGDVDCGSFSSGG